MGVAVVNGHVGMVYEPDGPKLVLQASIKVDGQGNPQHDAWVIGDPDDSGAMAAWQAVVNASISPSTFAAAIESNLGTAARAWWDALPASTVKSRIYDAAKERRLRGWGP